MARARLFSAGTTRALRHLQWAIGCQEYAQQDQNQDQHDAERDAISIGGPVIVAHAHIQAASPVRDLVVGSGLAFDDLGWHDLKGMPEQWHLYRFISDVPAATSLGQRGGLALDRIARNCHFLDGVASCVDVRL